MAGFFKKLTNVFTGKADIDWDELEEMLIAGDLGIRMTTRIIDRLQAMGRKISPDDVISVCREEIIAILPRENPRIEPIAGKPHVSLIVGVNGTGKTTSTAKLALHLKQQGHSVLLAAADTFRAAAIEQLSRWASRIDVPIVTSSYHADPSAVCFEAYQRAAAEEFDFLLCDTAGRLHTKHNLMEELKKIRRTLAKLDPESPHERLLVVDATTGSNATNQAVQFHAAADLTGVIVTKMDGSGKGGVVVPIQSDLGIPTRYVGTGEEPEQFARFDAAMFVDSIL
jgi:fused signal recognition particle receptor